MFSGTPVTATGGTPLEFPRFPCYSLFLFIASDQANAGDRVTAGFSVVLGLKRALKNRKFPVNSLFSGYSVEQGSPMTASTARYISLI
jgi:hypothetical protein